MVEPLNFSKIKTSNFTKNEDLIFQNDQKLKEDENSKTTNENSSSII